MQGNKRMACYQIAFVLAAFDVHLLKYMHVPFRPQIK